MLLKPAGHQSCTKRRAAPRLLVCNAIVAAGLIFTASADVIGPSNQPGKTADVSLQFHRPLDGPQISDLEGTLQGRPAPAEKNTQRGFVPWTGHVSATLSRQLQEFKSKSLPNGETAGIFERQSRVKRRGRLHDGHLYKGRSRGIDVNAAEQAMRARARRGHLRLTHQQRDHPRFNQRRFTMDDVIREQGVVLVGEETADIGVMS